MDKKYIEGMQAEKKDKLQETMERLEAGIMEIFDSDRYKNYLNVMSKFHYYSVNNTILIAMQRPEATRVSGYNNWKDKFHRQVRRGEQGIQIIQPAPYQVKRKVEKVDPRTGEVMIGGDGQPVMEETDVTIRAYKVGYVFDISQTDGPELPSLTHELTGDVESYPLFFQAVEQASPVPVGFEQIGGSSKKGFYHQNEMRIVVREGMSELQNIKTLIHEIAHAKLHDHDVLEDGIDRHTMEVQAESIAYTVCQHFGLDTSDYSFAYLAGWSSGKELPELRDSLEVIRSTASGLIKEISEKYAVLTNENIDYTVPEQLQEPEHPAPNEPASDKADASNPSVTYYPINEDAARRAKEASSFSDYVPGSATEGYHQMVDRAAEIAEQQKQRVEPSFHEKIDGLLDTYARKLAENMNKSYEIQARVPSILIAGGGNFPTRAKEKQNAAYDKNMQEWKDIQGLLDKIRSTGTGGISADDPKAVERLESKLAKLEESQKTMKAVNAYYRKYKTLDGCPNLSDKAIEKLKAEMSPGKGRAGDKPYPTWALSNNNAEIRRVKERIADLTRRKEVGYVGWEFAGGTVEANEADNRLQVFFEDKPTPNIREELKKNGFRWSPSEAAWQRQLNDNAIYAAGRIKSIHPLTGESPTELQKRARRESVEQKQPVQEQPKERSSVIDKLRDNQTKTRYNMGELTDNARQHKHENVI